MNSKRNSHLNSQRLPARRIRRLVTRYASDSDEEGGIVLKSKRYTDVTGGTAAGSDWMAKGANHIMAATSQQEVLLNKTQDRDVKAFGRANRSLCDDGVSR
ncbi:unnamed protein product [Toxocara canis]|uniref:Uncharacterized protein n=1 Tax=Toxocara canis TaxID=6265 RepID=A0A183VA57_TOXCA|nr:unnamed protein product [Toxocara canis]